MLKLIIGGITVVLAGGVFFTYTQPTYDSVQAMQASIAQYNTALAKAAELQQLKQSLLNRFNSFDTQSLDRLQKLLPDHVDNIALILDLDSIARRYSLALQNVDVSAAPAKTQTSQTVSATIGSSNQIYDSLTLTFSTQGTYANFQQFMIDLESSLRIVDLSSLTLARSGATGGKGETVYTFNITLRTYWLK